MPSPDHEPAPQESGATFRIPVDFPAAGTPVRGELFLPAEGSTGLPGVVVGTWTSVRQQMSDRYAERLAKEGFAALSFDFRTYGESDGEPREHESPSMKAVDIDAAARYLAARPEVAGGWVGGLGICASAGYMARAIADGAPIAAFATSAAWLHDAGTVGLFYGGDEGVARRLALADAARERFDRTGEVTYVPAESPTDPDAAMVGLPFYEDPERGLLPEWANRFAVMSWRDWLTFDHFAPAAGIRVPTILVHSEGAAFPDNVRRFHSQLAGPNALCWLEGEHTEFYDREPMVSQASRIAAAYLRTAFETGSGR